MIIICGADFEKVEEMLWQIRQNKATSKQLVIERCPLTHKEVDYNDYDFDTGLF